MLTPWDMTLCLEWAGLHRVRTRDDGSWRTNLTHVVHQTGRDVPFIQRKEKETEGSWLNLARAAREALSLWHLSASMRLDPLLEIIEPDEPPNFGPPDEGCTGIESSASDGRGDRRKSKYHLVTSSTYGKP